MKQFLYILILMMGVFGVSSCSQSIVENGESPLDYAGVRHNATRSEDNNLLAFENEIDFQRAIDMVASFDTDEEKLQWVEKRFPEFSSIQSLYWEAMHEMGDIDAEDKDVAERFLSKYSALYFPLYEEDGGFYIPMKNLDAAFLVNENCEVRVAGEVRNLRDIWSYDTLMELGRAYYSLDVPVTLGAMGRFH